MTDDQTVPSTDDNSNVPRWLVTILNSPAMQKKIQLGMFDLSIESLIRQHMNLDASRSVGITNSNLANALAAFAHDDVDPRLKSYALTVVSQALVAQEGAHQLLVRQQSAGRRRPQKSDEAERLVRRFYIARSAEDAEAAGNPSPNKAAAREHDCTLEEVKRARAEVRRIRALSDRD